MWCVLGGVLLSRTLAGAVPSALSGLASGFGMGAGRFPVAVTTETIVRAVRESLDTDLVVLCVAAPPVCGWVGCGPYSGRSRLFLPPPNPLCRSRGGGGGCCLCWPISTGQLRTVTGLPLPAYQPSGLLGAYQDSNCLVETLS